MKFDSNSMGVVSVQDGQRCRSFLTLDRDFLSPSHSVIFRVFVLIQLLFWLRAQLLVLQLLFVPACSLVALAVAIAVCWCCCC